MLIIELTYKKPMQYVESALEGHKRFLKKYYEAGLFIASGPKHPRDGGIILAHGDKNEMEKIITEDPFYQNSIAEYKITVFKPNRYSNEFKLILEHGIHGQ